MNILKILDEHTKVIAAVILVLIVLVPLGYSVLSRVIAQGAEPGQPFLERVDSKYENCVRDTTYMRLHHWELLRGMREEVVRYGKRGDLELNKCRECHTSRERFCDECHNTVSLTPDCWHCHYYP